jgi:hypothetical protein
LERFNHDEESAIQHAMNLKLQDEAAFFAEYQNEPLAEKGTEDEGLLTADQIAGKLNGMRRGEIPVGATHLTMFIDVQGKLLYWLAAAFEEDFTGYVVDYGAWPDQRRAYFTLRDAQRTLQSAAKGTGLEGAIYAGLEALTAVCLNREWRRDEGAEIAWPERFNHDELSAVQHAMNLKLQDEAAFFAEYQNEPLAEKGTEDEGLLTADQIAGKLNGMRRGEIPVGATRLTMFIDVQGKLLYWVVTAFEEDFTGYVVDYGAWPDQRRGYFTLRDAQRTLQSAAKGTGLEGAIYAGLEALTGACLNREWRRDDGAEMRIERCLVDANWGQSTDVVYQFCRQSAHAGLIMPSHGRYVGASSVPFSEYKRKKGERIGLHWRVPTVQGRRQVRHVVIDTNYWKSFVHARLAVAMGDPGSLSLFGRKPGEHQLLAEHLTAEYRVRTEGRGRVVDEWRMRPEAQDNHWLDGLVGCAVAASILGAVLPGTDARAAPARAPIKLSELQRGRR